MGNIAFGQPLKLARLRPLDEAIRALVETWLEDNGFVLVKKSAMSTIQDRVRKLEEDVKFEPINHRCERVVILEKRLEEVQALQEQCEKQVEEITNLKHRLLEQKNIKVTSKCTHAAILEAAGSMATAFFAFLGCVPEPRRKRVTVAWEEAVAALEAFDKISHP